MADRKQCMELISRFEKLLKANNTYSEPLNRYTERWAADDLIESFGISRLKDAMDYYFKVYKAPSWRHFARSAGEVLTSMDETLRDRDERAWRIKKLKELMGES